MARMLVYTSPARGHLYPVVGTLLELRRRGHDIHVRTLSSELAVLREHALGAEAISPAIEQLPLDDWRWSSPEAALAGGLRTFEQRAPHEAADLRRGIEDVDPDLLLVDVTTTGAAATAEASGLPWAQWIPFFQQLTIPGVPAPPPGLIPFSILPQGLETINAARRAAALDPLGDIADSFRAPLYLYFTAEPFADGEVALPPSVRPVGPGLWEPAAERPAWLADIGQPLVLVTASSEYQRDDALVTTALAALGDEDVRVAASTVAHEAAAFQAPPNARVERWLPHGPIIREAACVVCHGGMGITQRALAAGVPVCVVPFGRDQMEVAIRVTATGAGTMVMPDALTPAALRDGVRGAMELRGGARGLAEAFARAGGPAAAADAVEDQLGARAGDARPVVGGRAGGNDR